MVNSISKVQVIHRRTSNELKEKTEIIVCLGYLPIVLRKCHSDHLERMVLSLVKIVFLANSQVMSSLLQADPVKVINTIAERDGT